MNKLTFPKVTRIYSKFIPAEKKKDTRITSNLRLHLWRFEELGMAFILFCRLNYLQGGWRITVHHRTCEEFLVAYTNMAAPPPPPPVPSGGIKARRASSEQERYTPLNPMPETKVIQRQA